MPAVLLPCSPIDTILTSTDVWDALELCLHNIIVYVL